MSCGRPHERDCGEVLRQIFLFIDRELDEADAAQIRRHLDECAPCLAKYQLEQVVKALVARSCREQAPPWLRDRVLWKIHHVQVELRDDRGFPA